jgi:hypothetical protein
MSYLPLAMTANKMLKYSNAEVLKMLLARLE